MNSIENIDYADKDLLEKLYHENQELKSFAYLMSHDLKTPLRHIMMYIQILNENLFNRLNIIDEDTRHVCSVIESSTIKMDGMINNLIELWGIKEGGSELENIDLNGICAKVVSSLLEASTNDSVPYNIKWTNLPVVEGDPSQLFQLIMNLCSNGIKYQKPNITPKVKIDFCDKGDFWEFSVADNGIGIESKSLSRIFNPFIRLHAEGEYNGNGLGLSISKKIVTKHKGKIWAESEYGQGSTFYFTINKKI